MGWGRMGRAFSPFLLGWVSTWADGPCWDRLRRWRKGRNVFGSGSYADGGHPHPCPSPARRDPPRLRERVKFGGLANAFGEGEEKRRGDLSIGAAVRRGEEEIQEGGESGPPGRRDYGAEAFAA